MRLKKPQSWQGERIATIASLLSNNFYGILCLRGYKLIFNISGVRGGNHDSRKEISTYK